MTQQRHAAVKSIFLEIRELEGPARRARLEQLCGDDVSLRSEVESLLSFDTEASESEPRPRDRASRAAVLDSDFRLDHTLEVGQLYADRFRIVSLLGQGGMGQVYQAEDRILGETVALKRFSRPGDQQRRSALDEVKLARRITHPNVCRIFDFGETDDDIYISMEYVDGEDLQALLSRIGRLAIPTVLDLARQLLTGLAAAHAQGVVHRDLKPANIMIDSKGRARITDFGVATLGLSPASEAAIGTPGYMSPEQLGGQQVDARSDLYSLGLVLYEMTCGRAAFRAPTQAEVLVKQLAAEPVTLSELVPDVDPTLDAVIGRALNRDSSLRPASALAMATALPGSDPLAIAAAAGVTPPPDLVASAQGPSPHIRPLAATLTLVALVALLFSLWAISDRTFRLPEAGFSDPPEVLAAQASQVIETLGYDWDIHDQAYGFLEDEWAEEPERSTLFWYRSSAAYMEPLELTNVLFGGSQVDLVDPPVLEDQMSLVYLDSQRRLVYLEVIPDSLAIFDRRGQATTDRPRGPPPSRPEDSDTGAGGSEDVWDRLFDLARVDASRLTPMDPFSLPRTYADVWRGWEGTHDGRPVWIHAAALEGNAVFFELRDEESQEDDSILDHIDRQLLVSRLLFVLPLLALPFALANLRSGRGDVRGAARLVAFVLVLRSVVWLLTAHHLPDVLAEMELFLGLVVQASSESVLVWLSYVALEPWVRRWWPSALVSWSRCLAGRAGPLVGQGLLVGALAGTSWALLTAADRMLARYSNVESLIPAIDQNQLTVAIRSRDLFALSLDYVLGTIYGSLCLLLIFVLLRVGLGRPRPATVLFVLALATIETLDGSHPAISWLPLGLGIAIPEAILLIRFGLLALISARFSMGLLLSAPITTDLGSWYGPSGLYALLVVLGLGTFGWWQSVRGQAILPQPIGSSSDSPSGLGTAGTGG